MKIDSANLGQQSNMSWQQTIRVHKEKPKTPRS